VISQVRKADQLSGHQTLSDFWRKNVAHQEAAELACVLKAMRKVAGNIGDNVGLVEYAGMSDQSCGNIIIDPGLLMGTYPVPPEKIDVMVGQVTHEALHQKHWSAYVWKLLGRDFSDMSPRSVIGFQKMIRTGEDIYVDSTVDGSILAGYLQKVRSNALDVDARKLEDHDKSIDMLFWLWWAVASGYSNSSSAFGGYQKPLTILNELSENLLLVGDWYMGVTERCTVRADFYRAAWGRLEEMILSYRIVDKRLYWTASPGLEQSCPQAHGNPEKKHKAFLSPDLTRRINTQLSATSADITPLIHSVVGYDCPDVVPISRWDYHIPAHPVVDSRLVNRVRSLFYSYSDRIVHVNRGLKSGRLDKRRLYRAALNGNCFFQTEQVPSMDWNVTILVDASGSMRGNKWRIVENTIATIHKALLNCGVYFKAWAYFEIDGVCMLSSLVKGSKLFSVPPCGQTASGQAIMAAALLMPRERKKKLLIHITDGESNYGLDVQYGIEHCLKNNIVLVTLGCGCPEQEAMVRQYNNSVHFIFNFKQLPKAIEQLLKWTFIYGGNERRIRQRLAKNTDRFGRNQTLHCMGADT